MFIFTLGYLVMVLPPEQPFQAVSYQLGNAKAVELVCMLAGSAPSELTELSGSMALLGCLLHCMTAAFTSLGLGPDQGLWVGRRPTRNDVTQARVGLNT